jgi:G3E family GTPase
MADRWLSDTLSRQLLRADLIVLTKCDQADDAAKSETRAEIEAIRGDVPIIEIANGDLPDVIINPITSTRAGPMFATEMAHPFRTWHWHPERPLDEARFKNVIERLPQSVLRAKGFCRLGEGAEQAVFQLVGRRWSLERCHLPTETDELVVIGTKELPAPEELKALFATSLIAI